uniref:Reverse transcriptase n=1 Tax=Angiostrongylus cantonensis TaxID=6313 RepID=A0A158P6Q5_ANGCA
MNSGGFGRAWILGETWIGTYCNIYGIVRKRIGLASSGQLQAKIFYLGNYSVLMAMSLRSIIRPKSGLELLLKSGLFDSGPLSDNFASVTCQTNKVIYRIYDIGVWK